MAPHRTRSALALVTVVTLCCGLVSTSSSVRSEESTALTIYSTARPGAIPAELYRPSPGGRTSYASPPGYAVVREEREVELTRGRGELRFTDIAALIDPTTVRFESLTDPDGTQVIAQSYRFDLVSQQKLLERYLDQTITVEQAVGETLQTFSGRLLSVSGGLILEDDQGRVRALSGWSGIEFPDLPQGLITRPTLVWDVLADRGGTHRTRVSYQTQGMTWWADYNLVFEPGKDSDRGRLDVGAWVSIVNRSGAGYHDARLKLIAGDVARASAPAMVFEGAVTKRMAAQVPAGFEEKSFFEYHLYTLGRPTTLPDNSTQQLELFDAARGVPARKILVYVGTPGVGGRYGGPVTDRNFGIRTQGKVDVYLAFENSEESGLGIPLPSGRIRVSQMDPDDGSLEFIGEDVLDHTPRNEEVLIRLGSAFDVVGQRKQADFDVDTARRFMEETIELQIRNRKEEGVEVIVQETLYRWTHWDVVEASQPWEKVDARTIRFPLSIAAGEERSVRYRVRYTW